MKKTTPKFLLLIIASVLSITPLSGCGPKNNKEPVNPSVIVHSGQHFAAKNATCIDKGNAECWYCADCHAFYTNPECDEVKNGTWTNATGSIFDVLDNVPENIEIDPLGHDLTVIEKFDEHQHKVSCSRCDYHIFKDHVFSSDVVKEATHTSDGLKKYTCEICGYSYDEIIPKLENHSFTKQVVSDDFLSSPATCTEPAKYYYSCLCGLSSKGTDEEKTFDYGEPLGHDLTVIEKFDEHEHKVCCSRCDYCEFEKHTITSVVTEEPTHISTGLKTHSCSICGYSSEEILPKKAEHTFNKRVPAEVYLASSATCTEPAKYYYSCECGITSKGTDYEDTFEYGNPAGHKWEVSSSVEPTPLEDGYITYVCPACGDEKTEIIPSGHHLVHHDGKPATCTEDGYTEYYTCEDCDFNNMEVIPATGHHFELTTVQPDGKTRGYDLHKCTNDGCEEYYVENFDFSLYDGMVFKDTDKYIIPYYFSSQEYTFEFSFNMPKDFEGRGGVLLGSYSGKSNCLNFEISSGGKLRLYMLTSESTTPIDVSFDKDLRSDSVVNAAVILNKNSVSLYLDGEFVQKIEFDEIELPIINRNFVLGGDLRQNNAQYFKGTLYALSIFRDARTEKEMKDDCIIADKNDKNCCVSYNLLNQTSLITDYSDIETVKEVEVSTVDELEHFTSIGAEKIIITNDIVVDRTIYVIGKVKIVSNTDASLIRDPNFAGDMFVVGENELGRNLVLDGIDSTLTLGDIDCESDLTLDGNKDNMLVEVTGSMIYVNYSGVVTINDHASIINNKKVGNSRSLAMQQYYGRTAGGAAILLINGVVYMNGGLIDGCEVNTTDLSGGDTESSDNLLSSYGGAVFSYSNFVMNGGTIQNCKAYYGGAVANCSTLTKLYNGAIKDNYSSHAGGGYYSTNSTASQTYVGTTDDEESLFVFEGNVSDSSGGAFYCGASCTALIHGNVLFKSNYAKSNGGAISFGGYGEIEGHVDFIENSSGTSGGAIYISYAGRNDEKDRRECVLNDCLFEGNSSKNGAALSLYAADLTLKNSEFKENLASGCGGAVYANRDSVDLSTNVNITSCSFTGNFAKDGGACYFDLKTVNSITDCTFTNNESSTNGGAITTHGAESLNIFESTFTGNKSAKSGGAIYLSYRTDVVPGETEEDDPITNIYDTQAVIESTDFVANQAHIGGAIAAIANKEDTEIAKCKECYFNSNIAFTIEYEKTDIIEEEEVTSIVTETGDAGAVSINGGISSFDTCSFVNNISSGKGGALVLSKTNAEIKNAVFGGNNAGSDGGAIHIASNSLISITDVIATANAAGGSGGFVNISKSELTISATEGKTNVIGDASDSTKKNEANSGAAICVGKNAILKISDAIISNNNSLGSGVVYVYGEATMTNVVMEHNSGNYGGAITIYGGLLKLTGCDFAYNESRSGMGGAIYERQGSIPEGEEFGEQAFVFADNCSFDGNFTSNEKGSGGAVYVNVNSLFNGLDLTFENNNAYYGGALLSKGTLSLDGCTFENNNADYVGGAIRNDTNEAIIKNCTFTGNSSVSNGGAIHNDTCELTLTDCVFVSNTSAGNGGAVYLTGSNVVGNGLTFTGNISTNEDGYGGGAMYFTNSTGELNTVEFVSNEAPNGGAICLYTNSTLNIKDVIASKNIAKSSGGFIYVSKSYLGITSSESANSIIGGEDSTFANISTGGGAIGVDKNGTIELENIDFKNNYTILSDTGSGNSGGVLSVYGTATITNCNFVENEAKQGGSIIVFGGNVTISKCNFLSSKASNIGGAIYVREGNETDSYATVTIADSTFDSNSAGNGGAVYVKYGSTLAVSNSTFTNNSAKSNGGAISAFGALSVEDSEFTSNSAKNGGAIESSDANLTLNGCLFNENTATDKGGAIYANCSSVENRDLYLMTITDTDFIQNTATKEYADGSGAIGGAIYMYTVKCEFNSGTFVGNTATQDSGAVSVRGNSIMNVYEVVATGNSSRYGGVFYVNSSTLNIISDDTSKVVFGSTDIANYDTDKNYASILGSAIYGTTRGNVNVSGAYFGCNGGSSGSAVAGASSSTIVVSNSIFENNKASNNGGAVLGQGSASISLTDCSIKNNTASLGSAVYITDGASLTMSGTTIESNISTSSKGAVVIDLGCTGTINDSEFKQNSSASSGGAIYCVGTLNVTGTDFIENTGLYGGAIIAYGADITITECNFSKNTSTSGIGGAMYIRSGESSDLVSTVTIIDSTFSENSSTGNGGAIYLKADSTLTISGSTFTSNTAVNNGGAISVYGTATITDTSFKSNSAKNGGAIDVNNGTLTLSGCTFEENTGIEKGGALYASCSNTTNRDLYILTITDTDFINNIVTQEFADNVGSEGGAIYLNCVLCNFNGGTVSGSTASQDGGAICVRSNSIMNVYAIVAKGNSSRYGGAFYVNSATLNIISDDQTKVIFGSTNTSDYETDKNTSSILGGAIYGTTKANINISGAYFGCNGGVSGSAIGGSSSSTIVVSNSTFENNIASKYGAAIFGQGSANITVNYSLIKNNSAVWGPAIYLTETATFSMNGTLVESNASTSSKGAMVIDISASATIVDSEFKQNSSTSSGGAIYCIGTLDVTGTDFIENTGLYGGAIMSYGADITITECNFSKNTSTSGIGGAMYIRSGDSEDLVSTVAITDSSFIENSSTGSGGALYIKAGSSVTINGSTFTGNTAANSGGAIYCLGTISGSGNTFTGNTTSNETKDGGGAIYVSAGNVSLEDTDFVNNSAKFYGGAIYAQDSVLSFAGCEFNGNTAAMFGGAIYDNVTTDALKVSCTLTLNNTDFIANTVTTEKTACGGALYLNKVNCTMTGGLFANNTATQDSGAVSLRGGTEFNGTNITATGNSSPLGGVFYVNRSTLNISSADGGQSVFGTNDPTKTELGNNAPSGGVIYGTVGGVVTIDGAYFGYNTGSKGAAIVGTNDTGTVFTITNSTFEGNSTTSSGGAIYIEKGSTIFLENDTFISNSSATGGAVYLYATTKSLSEINGCTFINNTATKNGGAVYTSSATVLSIKNITLSGNTAGGYGPAIGITNGSGLETSTTIEGVVVSDSSQKIYISQSTSKVTLYDNKITDTDGQSIVWSDVVIAASATVLNNAITHITE